MPNFLPLVYLNVSAQFDSIFLCKFKVLIYNRSTDSDLSHSVDEVVFKVWIWFGDVDVRDDLFLGLFDALVDFDLLPLVHPNHRNRKPDQNDSKNESSK